MSRTIQPGEHVFTVSAFLICQEPGGVAEVLLIKHPKLGKWLQPGGHVEPDQDPLSALVCEIDDEVGINIAPYVRRLVEYEHVSVLPLPAHFTKIRIPAGKPNPEDPEHFMLDMGYLIRIPRLPVKPGVEHAWASRWQLSNYYMPEDIYVFLKNHL